MTLTPEKNRRPRISELTERVREHEGLVRALQGGEVDAVVVVGKDEVTLARLHSDEPLFRAIVDILPQAVVTVLADGTIVYANNYLAKSLEMSGALLLGRNIADAVADADRARFTAMLKRALTGPQELTLSFRWETGDAPALISAVRLPIADVETIGLVIVDMRDQVARQAAEESALAKDELLALVSHELRTPLTAIMGWVQLLELELAGDPHIAEGFRNLRGAIGAQIKIVDDLLDLSRSERGALSLAMKEFDLHATLEMALSFVNLQAHNKAVALKVGIPDAPLIVRGDPDRLRQVFVNLLSNAVKFTMEGEVEMHVRCDHGFVVATVRDSGLGISSEFLPFVFEPFRRSDRAKSYPGLGIGLAIARRLVEAHGGTIEASSDGPNRGATFTVRLPLVSEQRAASGERG